MQELDEKCENRKKIPTKSLALAGILLAAALVLSLVESLIPPIIPAAPYAKVGFANIVLIVALLTLGYPYAILIMLLKCVFTAVFSGNMFSLAYSIPAGFVAYTVSALVFRIPKTGRKYRHRQKRVAFVAVSYADWRDCGVGDGGYCVCFIKVFT